jgi:hypothetical protein
MYLFVVSHELAMCILDNSAKVRIAHRGTQLFCKFLFFSTLQSQSTRSHWRRCQIFSISTMPPINNGFLSDSSWKASSTFHQTTFLQSICSNSNCFFLSPMYVFDFLEYDGVCKFGGLVGRFVIKKYICQIFYMFRLFIVETNILMHRFYKVTYINSET